MALLKWLDSKLSGKDEPLEISPNENTLSGLNLKDALDAHNKWKDRLKSELAGETSTPIDVSQVAHDDNCVLGKWLYNSGKDQYSHLSEYEDARKAHAQFHLAAAEVVIENQSGNTVQAKNLLKTKFRSASNSNQLELVKLFTVARNTTL